MTRIGFTITGRRRRSLQLSFLFCCFSLCLLSGLADDPSSSSKNTANAATDKSSGASAGLKVLIVFMGLVAVVAFLVFLFRLWQKKKRQEQQARFLKLFEDDDELEVELGIRD
ncbi:uncharacterized protein LOC116203591 [Punica granatum]|uniref:Uncharacterized protein LOC116203591 n=2 Tax=Punica granatum TaxID=22663 RepID=A0A6P8D9P1_PUNGR|nr:uncharacterized protein LOC116203591 [Punica granatum]PKI42452.1 hypothetical protein CRG98_037160 [Punica granatum]